MALTATEQNAAVLQMHALAQTYRTLRDNTLDLLSKARYLEKLSGQANQDEAIYDCSGILVSIQDEEQCLRLTSQRLAEGNPEEAAQLMDAIASISIHLTKRLILQQQKLTVSARDYLNKADNNAAT